MSEQQFDTPAQEIPRDRWGRPLIKPEGGGKPVGYTRASSLGSALEDQYGLTMWKQRMTALGVASRSDLVLAVNAHREDRKKLNDYVDQAMDAAASGARATIGTSLHTYTEIIDSGGDPGYIPAEFAPDVDAYRKLTESAFQYEALEQFCVCDELQVAGTPDRVSRLRKPMTAPDGTTIPADDVIITDLKTSGSMDFGGIKFSVQLAVYAYGRAYTIATGERTPWPGPPRTDWGAIIHCPAGEGTAALYWVNLTAGWDLAKLSVHVRSERRRKDLLVAAETATADTTLDPHPDFVEQARTAPTVEVLNQTWWAAAAAGRNNDELLQVCRARKAQLVGGTA